MILQKFSILSLVLWLFFQNAAVPVPTPAQENKTPEISEELKKEAVGLLNSLTRETSQFGLPDNRIRTQIIVADLMWESDEKAARAIFQNALLELQNLVNQANAAPPPEELKTTEQTALYSKQYSLSELRGEYLLTLAPHDPKAALDALLSLKTEPGAGQEYDPYNSEGLELQLASAIAKKDPDKAYQLAKNQLKDGVSYQLVETLKDLFKKDSTLAAKLSRDVLAKLKTTKIRTPPAESGSMAATSNMSGSMGNMSETAARQAQTEVDFWQASSFVTAASSLNRLAARDKDKKLVPALTESEMKELVELVVQSFLAERNPAPYSIGSIMGEIKRYAPASAQRIRAKLGAEAVSQLESHAESSAYYADRTEKTLEELIADVDKAAPDMRDTRISEAVNKALEEDDPEKARVIANKIKDRKSYGYLFEQIEAALPLVKAKRGDLQEVRNLLSTLSTNEEKINTLAELAAALAAKGDKEIARKLLEESSALMTGRIKKREQLESALKIANAYALAAPDRAFALIDGDIAQMNEYINAGIMLDEFYDYGSLENDELLFSAARRQGLIHVSDSVNLLKNLAQADFQRTVALADKFQRPEIRFLVRLKIAQALLDPNAAEREKEERTKAQGEHEGH